MSDMEASMHRSSFLALVALVTLGFSFLAAPPAHAAFAAADLVAFGFDAPQQATGTREVDTSGHGNDGMLFALGTAAGRYGSAGDFVASLGSYVRVPDAASLNGTSGDLTVSLSLATTQSDLAVLAARGGPDGSWQVALDGGHVSLSVSGSDQPLVSTGTVNDGKWHTVTVVREHSGIEAIYVDGAHDIGALAVAGDVPASGDLFVGSSDGTGAFFNGQMDDFRVMDKAASSTDALLFASAPYPLSQ